MSMMKAATRRPTTAVGSVAWAWAGYALTAHVLSARLAVHDPPSLGALVPSDPLLDARLPTHVGVEIVVPDGVRGGFGLRLSDVPETGEVLAAGDRLGRWHRAGLGS